MISIFLKALVFRIYFSTRKCSQIVELPFTHCLHCTAFNDWVSDGIALRMWELHVAHSKPMSSVESVKNYEKCALLKSIKVFFYFKTIYEAFVSALFAYFSNDVSSPPKLVRYSLFLLLLLLLWLNNLWPDCCCFCCFPLPNQLFFIGFFISLTNMFMFMPQCSSPCSFVFFNFHNIQWVSFGVPGNAVYKKRVFA